jgi:hypothetical protein
MHEASEEIEQRLKNEDELVNGKQSVDQPSIMDKLRQARAELEEQETVDLEVPGYRGLLVARYHLLSGKELQKIGKRVRGQFRHIRDQQGEVVLAMASDTLINSCIGLFYKDEDDLHDISVNGVPLTYSSGNDLTDFFELPEAGTARDAILSLFGGEDRDIAIIEHYQRLYRWMRDTSNDVTADLLGEI